MKVKISIVVLTLYIAIVVSYNYITFYKQYSVGKPTKLEKEDNESGQNIVFIYTGRWKFLRIQLPHIYRELRRNEGIIDQVWFMMLKYDDQTHQNICRFVEVANNASKETIFSLHYMGQSSKQKRPGHLYELPYSEFFSGIIEHPYNKYFKLDDDIVYIHPGAFRTMIEKQNSSQCCIHFFNIAGSNWRCSWLHQKNKVYEETNPQQLKFQYDPFAKCGWKESACAELTIHTFLYHHKNNQLKKYFFKDLYLITDRKRFSINAFLLDRKLLDLEAIARVGPIMKDDEEWWTVKYSAEVKNPNCVVGEALVVHFGYSTVNEKLLQLGYLQHFEKIILSSKESFKMKSSVWETLGYGK